MEGSTLCQTRSQFLQLLDFLVGAFLVGLESGLCLSQMLFQKGILSSIDQLWRICDYGLEKVLFCDLFDIGKAQFGKEVFVVLELCVERCPGETVGAVMGGKQRFGEGENSERRVVSLGHFGVSFCLGGSFVALFTC
jgi:hypothetical protein